MPRLARPPGRDRATNTEPGPPDGADGGLQQLAQRLAAALALAGVGGARAEQPFLAAVEAERVRAEEEYRRKLALLDRWAGEVDWMQAGASASTGVQSKAAFRLKCQ